MKVIPDSVGKTRLDLNLTPTVSVNKEAASSAIGEVGPNFIGRERPLMPRAGHGGA